MRTLLQFVSALLILCLVESRPNHPTAFASKRLAESRIVGGQNAADGQWPNQLTLEYLGTSTGWTHICGAALINSRYALTAAHCIDGVSISNLRMWAGVLDRRNPGATNGQLLVLATYMLHQNYSSATPGFPNNIAIITLTRPVDLTNNVKNSILPPDNTNIFNHGGCFVTGYGRITSEPVMTDILQWMQIPVITNQDCYDRLKNVDFVDVFPTHMCVLSDPPGRGPCNGDAGSPLFCYPDEGNTSVTYTAGILSWGVTLNSSCNLQFPTVATRLSDYLQWIYINTP